MFVANVISMVAKFIPAGESLAGQMLLRGIGLADWLCNYANVLVFSNNLHTFLVLFVPSISALPRGLTRMPPVLWLECVSGIALLVCQYVYHMLMV
jgi:uncharacterized membrane protein